MPLLRGESVFNLFFENSTRTRTTFEIAAKRLSADVFNLDIGAQLGQPRARPCWTPSTTWRPWPPTSSSVRHSESGAPYLIAQHVAPHVHVVNAGDGRHAHPTQGLLDMYTIRHYKKDFSNLRVAIVGDVLHSRVARSDIHALTTLGRGRSARGRPAHPGACRSGQHGRARVPQPGRGHQGLRRHHHAAPAKRAHERRAAALAARSTSRALA